MPTRQATHCSSSTAWAMAPTPRWRRSAARARSSSAAASASVAEIVPAVHLAMRAHPRRGGRDRARIDRRSATVTFAGLGNIAGRWSSRAGQSPPHGLAHRHRRPQRAQDPGLRISLPRAALLIMHSDGLGTGWTLDRYPGCTRLHPLLIAGPCCTATSRAARDDATVVVAHGRQPHHEAATARPRMPIAQPTADIVAVRQCARRIAERARLRPPGPDADRHRGVGDRPQRLLATRGGGEVEFARRRADRRRSCFASRISDRGPGHRRISQAMLDGTIPVDASGIAASAWSARAA